MRLVATILTIIAMVILCVNSFHPASANVWVPDNEFRGYFDVNGTYTVVGAIKNTEDKAILPFITIMVRDNGQEVSESYSFSTVDSQKDIPFKIKVPEVLSKNATLEKPQVGFVLASHDALNIDVVYDRTLMKHMDGHTTGFIFNNDTSPAYGVKVYAAIYGKDGKFLDVGKSVETITKMEPGQKIAFSMYPDPQLASKVSYYSCFALGEDPTQTLRVQRDGKPFYITFLTSGSVTDGKFDDLQQTLTVTVRHPFPEKGFVNFMLPQESVDQKFSVTSNGQPVQILQSNDPSGNWMVAFSLLPRSTSYVTISGFEQHPLLPVGNFRIYLLVIIPIVAAAVSVIIWKKKKT